MKTKKNLFILCLLWGSFMTVAYSLELNEPFDNYLIEKANIEYYDEINFDRGQILDSTENSKVYLVNDEDNLIIIVEKENKYAVWTVLRDDEAKKSSIVRKNINNTGSDELIIYWDYYDGRSFAANHFSYWRSGIRVWDIDSYTCLLDLETHYSSDEWWTTEFYDEEEGHYYDDSVNTVRCEEYNVELNEKQMIIQLTKQTLDNECVVVNGEKYVYQLTDSGFVLDRKENGNVDDK